MTSAGALALYVSNLATPEADLQRGAKLWQSGMGQGWFPNLASLVARSTMTSEPRMAMRQCSFSPTSASILRWSRGRMSRH